MESSESHEPSYYEVALTNRQVLIAFVVLLTSIVAAFLSGVWIGRGGSSVARTPPGVSDHAAATVEAPLEQLTFFNGKDAGARRQAPVASGAPAVAARPGETPAAALKPEEAPADASATEAMRQNLDATMAANRTVPAPTAGARSAASPASPSPAGTRVGTPSAPASADHAASAPTAKQPPAAKPAASGKTFVQVYSSTNAARAKEILAELKKAGFAVAVAETPKNGATSYRVRVGPYADRAKATAAASRLRRQFRLETWVTDSP